MAIAIVSFPHKRAHASVTWGLFRKDADAIIFSHQLDKATGLIDRDGIWKEAIAATITNLANVTQYSLIYFLSWTTVSV